MIKAYKNSLIWFILTAISLTGFGFLIDNDPAYPELSTSLMEFGIISLILFTLLSGLYFLISYVSKLISTRKVRT